MSEITEPFKMLILLSPIHRSQARCTTCPECDAQFEIEDRLECVFGKTHNPRLPAIGTICTSCSLIQPGSHQNFLHCGAVISTVAQ